MCFMAGANAVFTGEEMLTTPCKHFPPFFRFLPSAHLNFVPRSTEIRFTLGRGEIDKESNLEFCQIDGSFVSSVLRIKQ